MIINLQKTVRTGTQGFAMSLVVALVALVAVIGGISYFVTRPQAPVQDEVMIKPEGATMSQGDAMMEKKEGDAAMDRKEEVMVKDGGVMTDAKAEEPMMKYSGVVLAGTSAPLLDFTKGDYDAAIKTDKLVALYFFANWCPICRAEFPLMQEAFNGLQTDQVIGFRVNFNDSDTDADEKNLAREFGVAYQHTKVFLKNGQRVLKSPEQWPKDRYLKEINTYISQ